MKQSSTASDQSGVAHLALIIALVVVVIGAVGYYVFANQSKSVGVNSSLVNATASAAGKIKKCETNLTGNDGFVSNDLANYEADHYVFPEGVTLENPAPYSVKRVKGADGTEVRILNPVRQVEVYAKGGKSKKKTNRENYAINLARHKETLDYFKAKKPAANFGNYASAITRFEASISGARDDINKHRTEWGRRTVYVKADCTDAAKQALIAADAKKRSAYLGQMRSGLKSVKSVYKKTQSEYKKAAKTYKNAP